MRRFPEHGAAQLAARRGRGRAAGLGRAGRSSRRGLSAAGAKLASGLGAGAYGEKRAPRLSSRDAQWRGGPRAGGGPWTAPSP